MHVLESFKFFNYKNSDDILLISEFSLFFRTIFCHQEQFIMSYFTTICALCLWTTFAVIQDVDNASLEGQYQSFASLMEQRLAELFVLAGQQGTRFRRATTVGSFTVQVTKQCTKKIISLLFFCDVLPHCPGMIIRNCSG